jgi:hypothetical protein
VIYREKEVKKSDIAPYSIRMAIIKKTTTNANMDPYELLTEM